MNEQAEKFIKDNRLSMSMVDMGRHLGISYNRVRNYMIENNLTLTQDQINRIKMIKRKQPKAWNWDALP